MSQSGNTICVLGGGAWGTALAVTMLRAGHAVDNGIKHIKWGCRGVETHQAAVRRKIIGPS